MKNISFLGLLTIVFITLKLTNIIDWSWWLVLLPFYGPFLIKFLFIGLAVLITFLGFTLAFLYQKKDIKRYKNKNSNNYQDKI